MVDADERGSLGACLDYLRSCVVAKLAGVDEGAAARPQVPSGTSLHWLAQHLTAVEIQQFQRVLAGRPAGEIVPPPPRPLPDDSVALALARYETACAESRTIVAGCPDLGRRAAGRDRHGEQPTVRWVLLNAIQETARHAGHIDILREQVDGATGR